MPSQAEIRREITNKIVAALEKDLIPWRQPWTCLKNFGRPANVESQRPYTGVNPLLLEIHAHEHGFQSRYWGTYRQWQALGLQVQKRPIRVPQGRWGCQIVFYKPINIKLVSPETGEEWEEEHRLLRSYVVFNAAQVSGPTAGFYQAHDDWDALGSKVDCDEAEQLICATKAEIRFGGDRAFYMPPTPQGSFPNHSGGDYIQLPPLAHYSYGNDYYSVVFHELAHWSKPRLGYKATYEMGELIADMSACFTCAEVGVPQTESLDNHAAYIKHWLAAMKGDASYIFQAATMASRTTDFLLTFVRKPQPAPGPVAASSSRARPN